MPPYLPYQTAAIYFTGACEIIFGLLLLPQRTRRVAAILIIILLIVVFPANIEHRIENTCDQELDMIFFRMSIPTMEVKGQSIPSYNRQIQ